ncbi:uncharacterized protein IL334_007712 [Kwoniella shivajii]|uniref:Phosducin thioredoxin-like domain-containing protein n=1 Tax=Kwoniella shivajii TaxID=564305 RepID=A0ABZ1DBP2_9TREE|nr:hypothetical protein IL334_007712 [Kwoniella shivajii]
MPDSLETAALNGSLFTFDPSPSSPSRSASSISPDNTDDELGSDYDEPSNLIGGKRGDTSGRGVPDIENGNRTVVEHDGPQTGPKGVIEDRKAHNSHSRQIKERQNAERVSELNRRAIVGLTIHEEDQLRKREQAGQDDVEVEEWRRKRKDQLRYQDRTGYDHDEGGNEDEKYRQYGRRESVKRGGLKEVGKEGFIDAVERNGWVVVLIYEPDIPRCTSLLASLLHLSLNLPSHLSTPISLYRARASSLEFSLLPPTSSYTTRYEDEEPVGVPDPDVLPTLLVYKNGELEKTWVRVDWEIDQSGVEGLLRKEGILSPVNQMGMNRKDLLDEDDKN